MSFRKHTPKKTSKLSKKKPPLIKRSWNKLMKKKALIRGLKRLQQER